jgi:DNA polymerase-4
VKEVAALLAPYRKIIHVDMDAFYASVEQRDNPALRGKPVVVGGDPRSRGVVAACSYEARKFGIHSAMACARAYRLCPRALFVRPRFEVYRSVSAEIMALFKEYTDLVEPLSLDEAFLDVTINKKGLRSATQIAESIKALIKTRTHLTASAGVSFNKFLAKVASDVNKPDGITVVVPEQAAAFIDQLPIRKFHGVGCKTEARMKALGIRTGADLKRMTRSKLVNHFGKSGNYFYGIAHGIDERPVTPHRERKSIGKETTLAADTTDMAQVLSILESIAVKLEKAVRRKRIQGRTITLKIKYHDFQLITRSRTVNEELTTARQMMEHIQTLLPKTYVGLKKIRLLGISISNLHDPHKKETIYQQLPLPFVYKSSSKTT